MLGERSRPHRINSKGAPVLIASDPASYAPISCRAQWIGDRYVNASLIFTADTMPGYRAWAGNAFFNGMSTILPPNNAVCMIGNGAVSPHWFAGIWTPTSEHGGGVTLAFGDGSVRFFADSVDSGNLAVVAPTITGLESPYGVWGALGTKSASDNAVIPE
jgi:prepilin-type processing-associated H-X9-DG protein